MAMSKKDSANMEELKEQLRVAKALRFTDVVTPDIPVPLGDQGLSRGYLYAGTDYPRVELSCSSSVHHSFGNPDRTTSQGARRLFSTKLLALRALRHELEIDCANKLAKIDRLIEEELK